MASALETRDANADLLDLPAARSNTSLLSIVWQRKSLVILGIVIAMTLGALFFAQRTKIYQTNAQILVVNKGSRNSGPTNSGPNASSVWVEDYMSTQATLLKSQVIAERTANSQRVKRRLETDGFLAFPEATKPDDLIPGIVNGLGVTRDNKESTGPAGNSVLVLQFRCTDSSECQFLLSNLIEAYQSYIDDTYKDISETIIRDIQRQYDDWEKKVDKAEDDYQEFLKTAPPLALGNFRGNSPLQKKQNDLADKITKTESELHDREFQLNKVKEIYKEFGERAASMWMNSRGFRGFMTGDPERDKEIQKLQLMEKDMLSQYGENHPNIKRIRTNIELLSKSADGGVDGKPGVTLKPAEQFIQAMELDVKSLKELVTSLKNAHQKLTDEVRSNIRVEAQDERLRSTKLRYSQMFEEVSRMAKIVDQRKESGGFKANMITRPGYGIQIAPVAYQVFTASGLLGVLLGIGLAYLAEVSDKSFRNPAEIRRRLGLPVIGHVPFMAADEKAAQLVAAGSSTLDPMLVTHYQSNSIGAEAYRGVRTALYFNTQGAGHQVIQVTSPNVSDGKSTLAANLAVSIAQSGKRTLLIDCDFRKPRVHKIFNVGAQLGFASAMAGQADLNSCIQTSAIPNLSIMPCGPRPSNPAELLTSPKFSELIEELRRMFDFVIVDTPPILVVTDPAVVAPRVDGVVLCIRVTKNGRPFAERAREVLQSLGANVLGVVVNGFGNQVGGNKYGYEHYNYGYGESYSYTYGYSYGYADKEAASYYGGTADEPQKDAAAKS